MCRCIKHYEIDFLKCPAGRGSLEVVGSENCKLLKIRTGRVNVQKAITLVGNESGFSLRISERQLL